MKGEKIDEELKRLYSKDSFIYGRKECSGWFIMAKGRIRKECSG